MRCPRLFFWSSLCTIFISMLVLAQSGATLQDKSSLVTANQNSQHPLQATEQNADLRKETKQSRGRIGLSGKTASLVLSFAPVVTYPSGGFTDSIVVADVNGDGKPDIVFANLYSSELGVMLGNGDGTFQPVSTYYGSGGYLATSVAVADVNGDGKPDIVVSNDCATSECEGDSVVGVLLGNGDGTFQPAVTYDSGGAYANSVAVADVNGDGKPDIVVTGCIPCNTGFGLAAVLLGNGDGTFKPAISYGTGGYNTFAVAVADVNGDGKPDIVVANYCQIASGCLNGGDGSVGVLLGNGDGTFQSVVTYDSGGSSADSIAIADMNGDGKPDILVANGGSAVDLLLGNGNGTFQNAVDCGTGGYLAVADVNGDGSPDITTVGENTVWVQLNNGNGTFQLTGTYNSGGWSAYSVAVADVNGDGKPDIVVANECPEQANCYSGSDGLVGVLINTSRPGTTTLLASSLNPSSFGQSVTFTATVTPQRGTVIPTGTVSFFDGTTNIGKSNLNGNGIAQLATSTLPVGTDAITATYNGDSNFAASTSPVLYQIVQGAIASLSPGGLSFGNQTVGITSAPQGVTLQNNGNINLTITSIGTVGTDKGDFGQSNNCGTSLPPNGTCTIYVTFTPTGTGIRTAALSVVDNAPGSPQSVSLTGVGVMPAVTLLPTGLAFPTQVVFTSSKPQTVTLTNTGLGVLNIAKIALTGPFRQTNNCGTSMAPGTDCTFTVTFAPTTKGVLNGAIFIADNAPSSPQKVTLQGTGTYVQLTPRSVNFGNQPVGTTSLPKTITLSNKGSGSVSLTDISIAGADPGDFSQSNNCGKSVAAGASCFIKVKFTPTVTGARSADISVDDNGGGGPQKVGLAGTGT